MSATTIKTQTPVFASPQSLFEKEALDFYNSLPTDDKPEGLPSISDYKVFASLAVCKATVKTYQHAHSKHQAILLRELGEKYEICIFDLDEEPSTSIDGVAGGGSADGTSVKLKARLNAKISAIHRRTDNLINHPGQQGNQSLHDSVKKIFEKINEMNTLLSTNNEVVLSDSATAHYKRETFKIFLKLHTGLPKLCIDKKFSPVINLIMAEQNIVLPFRWSNFVNEYQNIIKNEGNSHPKVREVARKAALIEHASTPAACTARSDAPYALNGNKVPNPTDKPDDPKSPGPNGGVDGGANGHSA